MVARQLTGVVLAALLVLAGPAAAQVRGPYDPPTDLTNPTVTGQIKAPAADNCTAPPYSYTSDLNTGICSPAADTIAIRVGGTNLLTVGPTDVTLASGVLMPDGTAPTLRGTTATTSGLHATAAGAVVLTHAGTSALTTRIGDYAVQIGTGLGGVQAARIGTATADALQLHTNSLDRWSVTATGILQPAADNSYTFGGVANRISSTYLGTSLLVNTTAASALHADVAANATNVIGSVVKGDAATNLIVVSNSGATPSNAMPARLAAFRTRSSTGSDADTAVASADEILRIAGWAADGAAYRNVADIRQEVDTYTGSDNVSGRIGFYTRGDGAAAALTERLRVPKAGGFMWLNGTEPTCDANGRGTLVLVQGGAGVADTFRVCTKDAADAYAYRALF